jgi:hypothetical protein
MTRAKCPETIRQAKALAAFRRYFKKGGYQYGEEETKDARWWFFAGFEAAERRRSK